jgi:hypothetical protein
LWRGRGGAVDGLGGRWLRQRHGRELLELLLDPGGGAASRRKFTSQAEARMACFSYIEGWYNPVRSHREPGYRSPRHTKQNRRRPCQRRSHKA